MSAFLVVALALVGVAGEPSHERADAVLEAVLKGVAKEFLTEEVRATGAVACLQIDPGAAPQSVSREFLRRFKSLAFVRRGAECETRSEGAVELATGAPAVIITAGPIEWAAADEAHVHVRYFRSNRESASRLYRVVREPSGWVFLGQIIKMSPA